MYIGLLHHLVNMDLLLTSSSSDSSSDEELLGAVGIKRVLRAPKFPFEYFNDSEFHMRYRSRKETVMRLEEYIGHNIQPATHRNQSVSAINQILVTLRFLATGAVQILLGDDMNFHKTTVCRIVQGDTSNCCPSR